jgi:hypothetical protein
MDKCCEHTHRVTLKYHNNNNNSIPIILTSDSNTSCVAKHRVSKLCMPLHLNVIVGWVHFFREGGVILVPKRGCLLTLEYYVFPRWYGFGERRWNDILTGEKPAPVPLCPPQIPHGLTRARTWVHLEWQIIDFQYMIHDSSSLTLVSACSAIMYICLAGCTASSGTLSQRFRQHVAKLYFCCVLRFFWQVFRFNVWSVN